MVGSGERGKESTKDGVGETGGGKIIKDFVSFLGILGFYLMGMGGH